MISMAAARSSSAAATAAPQIRPLSGPSKCLPARLPFRMRSSLPSTPSLSVHRSRNTSLCVRAVSSEDTSSPDVSKQLQETFEELKAKYDALENKSTVWIYGGGAVLALWLSSVILSAVNTVPLLPKILELVGIGYSGWFVYRYLLFKSSRKQLAADIEDLKLKITGVPRSAFMTEDDE